MGDKVCERPDGNGKMTMWFHCPGCDENHQCTGWTWNGSKDKPTFSPSIRVRYFVGDEVHETCHSFIRDGRIEFLDDCTHALVRQTVDLPDWVNTP